MTSWLLRLDALREDSPLRQDSGPTGWRRDTWESATLCAKCGRSTVKHSRRPTSLAERLSARAQRQIDAAPEALSSARLFARGDGRDSKVPVAGFACCRVCHACGSRSLRRYVAFSRTGGARRKPNPRAPGWRKQLPPLRSTSSSWILSLMRSLITKPFERRFLRYPRCRDDGKVVVRRVHGWCAQEY